MLKFLLLPLLAPLLLLPPTLTLFLVFLSLLFLVFYLRLQCISQRINGPTIAFFHPYCNAGGGGERVLWQCVLSVVDRFPKATVYIYTGDVDATPEQIIANAENCFGLNLPSENVQFIYLKSRFLVEAKCYPMFTLLGQSLGSMVVGLEALWKLQPAYFVDSMGYAFTYLMAELVGCDVISYVHYPTISTDMLGKVAARESSYNNASAVAGNPLLSSVKLIYYKIFAKMYSVMGAKSKLVFVNSSWTKGHIDDIWQIPDTTTLLYPPCNTEKFLKISGPRSKRIVSVAQFRPEKDHKLQIESFAMFVEKTGRRDVTLTLVGGVRNQGDRDRVESLKQLSKTFEVDQLVEFKVSIPYSELYQILSDSLMGLHTMWNEHFGIGVVEFMAAGIIPIAHNSGGPKLDIVVPGTGFLAATAEEYSDHVIRVLEMTDEELEGIRERGREHVMGTFSDAAFSTVFIEKCVNELDMDLRWIEEFDAEDEERLEEFSD